MCYPRHEEFVSLLVKRKRLCVMWKLDLSRPFRQLVLHVDPHDFHLQGYEWKGKNYIDNRLIFGLRSPPQACQRITNVVTFMWRKSGIHTINYVNDFGGAITASSAEIDYTFVNFFFRK